MEESILIITVLIALSYVSERLSNILKLKISDKLISSVKSTDKAAEKKREKRILYISLISGVFVSTLFFLSIHPFSEDESKTILQYVPEIWWQKVILIILTGFLLSFGSKFWHDLLDIVLSIKNIRQTVAEEKAITTETNLATAGIERFKKLSNEEQRKLIHGLVKEQASNIMKQYPEIQSLSVRKKLIYDIPQNYYCLHVNVIEKNKEKDTTKQFPPSIQYTSGENIKYTIPTDVTGVGENSFLDADISAEQPTRIGQSCSRREFKSFGTIGLKVYKNDIPYLLSCYHVLCQPELLDEKMIFNSSNASLTTEVVSPGAGLSTEGKVIAEISEGWLDETLDVALAKLKDHVSLDNVYHEDHKAPEGRVDLSSHDTAAHIDLKLISRVGIKRGRLKDHYESITKFPLRLRNKTVYHNFSGLISTELKSAPGDSGATVLNSENKVVGLLVGGNEKESYLIPINRIFDTLLLDYEKL